jgi:hypothetical protein
MNGPRRKATGGPSGEFSSAFSLPNYLPKILHFRAIIFPSLPFAALGEKPQKLRKPFIIKDFVEMAERGGFEPPIRLLTV